jgi:radical SAM family uncharacterized protein
LRGAAGSSVWPELKGLLLDVERPSRYLGGEFNSPDVTPGGVSVALAYPDVYEIGASHLGLAILSEVVNAVEGATCERVYSPWTDMEALMREHGVPLFTLETHRPVAELDVFGISLPHELTYTNVLNLIDLAGISLRSRDRVSGPLVVAGGCGAANPESLADFIDLFILGEAEERILDLVELVRRCKERGLGRDEVLSAASSLHGVYRPAAYEVSYKEDGTIDEVAPRDGAPAKVLKNIVDIEEWDYPRRVIVPHCEAVHDRLNVELFRGCTRGCRFCQAGMVYRPVRERSPEEVARMVETLARATGYEEVSLCSLSSADYSRISEVGASVSDICSELKMQLSLPSLRMDSFSVELASRVSRGQRGGITFAPEAGSERLRRVINKPLSEQEMTAAVVSASRAGRKRMKLYFMIGLPTETDADVEEISALVFRLRQAVKAEGLGTPGFNVSVSTFVPKAQTPFQWVAQESMESVRRKQDILKRTLRGKGLKLSWHEASMSEIEGLLARGDRRVGAAIEESWRAGARFDSWSDNFSHERWLAACAASGVDPAFYAYRERRTTETLPWDHISFGVDKSFLEGELDRAVAGDTTPDCRWDECARCGVCDALDVEPVTGGERP